MVLKHFVLSVFLGIFIFAGYLSWHLGFFQKVETQEIQDLRFLLLGKEHIGPYHMIGPKIQEVEEWAKTNGISCQQSFGVYFDDPNVTAHERLKSMGGCILSKPEMELLKEIELPPEFTLSSWEAKKAINAKFSGAPSISPYKVYPTIEDLAREQRLTLQTGTLEIYELTEDGWRALYYRKVETTKESSL